MDKTVYKTRLRNKGQITVPSEVRQLLGAKEGDDLLFYADECGHVVVSRAQIIPPDQAWFWSQRWQQQEREAQADLQAGRVLEFADVKAVLAALDQLNDTSDAED